ncbi:MAG: hypothetical protein GX605_10495, partial [Chloroflexi bacterium]|nr:hypothetical protein [Chloroflexota bacterium]
MKPRERLHGQGWWVPLLLALALAGCNASPVEPTAASPATPTAAPLPASTPSPGTAPPEGAALAFYAALGAHRFAEAHALLTPAFQARWPLVDLAEQYAGLSEVGVQGVEAHQQDAQHAQATVRLLVMLAAGDEFKVETREATWGLQRLDGAWRLDSLSERRLEESSRALPDPAKTVQQFYGALEARQYPVAHNLLSREARAAQPLEQFAAEHARVMAVRVESVQPGVVQGLTAAVPCRVQAVAVNGFSLVTRLSDVTWRLALERGQWRLIEAEASVLDEQARPLDYLREPLEQFYRAVQARQFDAAYGLLTPAFRERLSLAEFAAGYDNMRDVRLVAANTL